MKNYNILLVLGLFLIISCGDDENEMNSDSQFVGSWSAESLTIDGNSTSELDLLGTIQTTETNFDLQGDNFNYNLNLNEDLTFATSGSYDFTGTVSVSGQNIPLNDSYTDVSGSGNYRVVGDSIYTTGAFFDFTYNGEDLSASQEETGALIESISDSEMVLVQNVQNTTIQDFFGTITTTTTTLAMRSVWKK